jgi:hypothetical protein
MGATKAMTAGNAPRRHWRSYGTDPLPTAREALGEPFAAFPSWFLRIACDRCGNVQMLNKAHVSDAQRNMPLRDLLTRMRHDGCGGLAARAELLTGIDGVSGRARKKDHPARRRLALRIFDTCDWAATVSLAGRFDVVMACSDTGPQQPSLGPT